jgi:outer membrane receptor protein involved in Fe transport
MLKRILLLLAWVIAFMAMADTRTTGFAVSGQVIDSLTRESLPYVTCSVFPEKNPQQAVTRFAADAEGKFNGELKTAGNYTLLITFVGKQTTRISFSVDENRRVARLGTIALAGSEQSLKELEVVAVKPLIKAEADRISYDTAQDPESQSSTVLDMLRKVPMVTVDGQDNIQLKGSGNFKFFLNGKPTNMFNNNPGLILKSFPASMVSKIEVITQPGAKYDAEGIGGIINIVTMQQATAQGYSATANVQASSRGSYGGGLNLMLQQGKFSFSGNYSYIYNKQFPVITDTERSTYVAGSPYATGKQVATVNNVTPMQFGSGQLSYEPDSLNLFTFSFNRRFGRTSGETEAETESFDGSGNKLFEYSQVNTNQVSWGSTDFGLDYQRSFKRPEELFTLSYKLSNTPNNSNFEATNTINPSYVTLPQPGLSQWSKSDNKASTNEHTFQADYTLPVAKGHKIESGLKYILRLNNSETEEAYKYFDFTKPFPYSPFIDKDSTWSFLNQQDILGAYMSYTGNVGKWGIKTGVRYEYTWLTAEFDDPSRDFGTDYGALVPSAIITYQLAQMQSLKLGYNKRIQRPGIGFLNPYVDRRDPNYINYGNPDLDPENSHAINFGYSSFAAKYNLNAELEYSFVNNAIEQYSFIRDGSAVQEITYDNIGKNRQLGVNLFGSYRGLPWLNLFVNSNVSYVSRQSESLNLANDGFTGRLFVGGTFMLPKDFRISTGAGGNLPQINLQGSQSAFYFSYAAISKAMLKKRLNMSLSAVYLPVPHIILNTKGINPVTGQTSFEQRTDVFLTSQAELRFNVSYRIGNINAEIKKTKKTISNDDQKTKEQSNLGESPM